MRLPFFTLFLCNLTLFSLFPTLVSSTHPHALARRRDHTRSPVPHVLTSRQHHVVRDLLDVCINVNVNLLANASQLLGLETVLGPLDLGSKIELCLCLKGLDIYLETNDDVQVLVGFLGKNTVGALITALIDTSPDARKCTFPQHAHHTCNTHDPCHYECDPPYILKGGACVCAPPHSSCNGICGTFPQGCGSAAPRSIQARANSITTLAQAKASCKPHETVCGIAGRESSLAFECIDTLSTEDSCGGCITPHPFFETEPIRHSSGKDCTTISKAKGVSCSEERCVVHTCTSGWTPSLDKAICAPVPSTSSKMRRVIKRLEPLTLNATANADLDSDIVSQVVDIVQLVLGLAEAPINLGSPSSSSNADIPGVDATLALLADVNTSTAALITSLTNPASLLASVDALLNSTSLLRATLDDCGCVQALGLSDTLKYVDDLLAATLALQSWCSHHTVVPTSNHDPIHSSIHPVKPTAPSSPKPSSSHSLLPSSSGANVPIVVGLSKLLTDLGVLGPVTGVIAVDGLGNGPDATINGLLDGVDIGPHDVKRRATGTGTVLSVGVPAATQAPPVGTTFSVSPLPPASTRASDTPTSTSTIPNSEDVPIVISPNRLLNELKLGGVDDVATIDGLLGNGPDNSANELLDALDIGPHDVRRDISQGKRQGLMKERRQVAANADVSALLGGGLAAEVDTLVNLVLGLATAGNVLPPALSDSAPITRTTSFSVGIPSHSSSVAIPVPSSSPSGIDQSLIDNVVAATLGLLSIPTYAEFMSSINALVAASVASLRTLEGCSCAEEVYSYLFKIVEAAQALSSCQLPASTPTSTSGSSAGHQPLAVGLTKLLNGLGLNITADTAVDGVLGDELDNTANSLLDVVGIGPSGLRRRFAASEHAS